MTKQSPTPAKAPDNNKRLAALEAGVSALAIGLTANGITLEDGADPIAAALAAIKAGAAAAAGLETLKGAVAAAAGVELDTITDPVAAALGALDTQGEHIKSLEATIAAGPSNATDGEIAAIARADKAEGELKDALEEIKELTADVEDAISEKNRLANELANAGQSSSAPVVDEQAEEAPPAPVERVRPETARDVGPTAGGLNSAELAELLPTADGLELVFSNGEFEIVALAPVAIGPKELLNAEGRQMVVPAVFAKLLNTDPQEELAGVGLLMQGEQIAYCSFPDRLTLQPGSERRFERAIYF